MNPNNNIALFLDFDGTLAEIQPNPNATTIDTNAKDALQQLVARQKIFLAIISGRQIYDVRNRLGIEKNVTFSGNHGMEVIFTNGTEFHYPITPEMASNCTKLKSILRNEVSKSHVSHFVCFSFEICVDECHRNVCKYVIISVCNK